MAKEMMQADAIEMVLGTDGVYHPSGKVRKAQKVKMPKKVKPPKRKHQEMFMLPGMPAIGSAPRTKEEADLMEAINNLAEGFEIGMDIFGRFKRYFR